jgi:hypothetical protein
MRNLSTETVINGCDYTLMFKKATADYEAAQSIFNEVTDPLISTKALRAMNNALRRMNRSVKKLKGEGDSGYGKNTEVCTGS